MLETIVVAAALFVCPGGVYTDTPRAGCHPASGVRQGRLQHDSGGAGVQFEIASSRDGRCRKTDEGDAIPPSRGISPGMCDVRGMGQIVHQVEQHWSPRSLTGRIRTVDKSKTGLREQPASQLSVTVRCPPRGSAISRPHPAEPLFICLPRGNVSNSLPFDPGCQPWRSGR